MKNDKFSAVWLSHSSLKDFITCPRLYFLRAVYKDPLTGHKITQVTAPLTLGQVVHDTIDSISELPASSRMDTPLMSKFLGLWNEVSGERGGFRDPVEEKTYKDAGVAMIERLMAHPGPLLEKAIKIKEELPHYWFNEAEGFILCGKIDWLIYKEDTDSVHILDFKTGKREESDDSLQLPIYHMLVKNTQNREVSGASYWYLQKDDNPIEKPLPETTRATDEIMSIARRMKLARQLAHFTCQSGNPEGCRHCAPLEAIKNGKGKKVGVSKMRQDIYIL